MAGYRVALRPVQARLLNNLPLAQLKRVHEKYYKKSLYPLNQPQTCRLERVVRSSKQVSSREACWAFADGRGLRSYLHDGYLLARAQLKGQTDATSGVSVRLYLHVRRTFL